MADNQEKDNQEKSTPSNAGKPDLSKPMPRGAFPSPRSELAAAMPHVPDPKVAVPPSFLMWPIQMSSWNNYIYGDCVSAEEAFAKATTAPQIFIPEATVVAWATANGYLNGAGLSSVLTTMQTNGFPLNYKRYDDGPHFSVNWTNASTLQSAIYSYGPVKIGVGAGEFQSNPNGLVTPGASGWAMYNYPKNQGEDHCTSLCGYGTLAQLVALFKQHNVNVTVPNGMPTGLCYAMFSWNSIGIIDAQSMLNMTYEAWIRSPGNIVHYFWNLQELNLGGQTTGPAAIGDVASFIYNNQSHVLYRDGSGKVWDSWYDGATGHWNLQQINLGGQTAGPAAGSDPAAFVYNNQAHVLYHDGNGKIFDSWYDGSSGHWNLQQINNGGLTAGPPAFGDLASFVYNNQTHVLYRDGGGKVWDSWYDGNGHWNLQQINLGGLTAGPVAVSNPASFVYNNQTHVLYHDASGKVFDSWYDGNGHWNLQQINLGGLTAGPAAASDPVSFIYNNQSHVLYRDGSGKVWDSWYDGNGHWNLQQINLGGLTGGPAAVGDVAAFIYNNQSHVLYRDINGEVWDSWYDGNHWNLQLINLTGLTLGPAAISDPASFVYNNQTHVLYRDAAGRVWDSWYPG
jgi:hypothetical protein